MVNTERYQLQLTDLNRSLLKKRPEYQKRQHEIILLNDNVSSQTANPGRNTGKQSAGKFCVLRR